MIKYLLLILQIIILSSCVQSQTVYLKLGESKIQLEIDSSSSVKNYFVYKSFNQLKLKHIKFENVPSNMIDVITLDGSDTVQMIDDKVDFNFNFIDTIDDINKVDLKLLVRNKELKNVKFSYQVVGNNIRVSDTYTNEILVNQEGVIKISELLNKLNQGGVILSGITFYDNEVLHTISIGYVCLIKT